MSTWEEFKKRQTPDEAKPVGREIQGTYRCQLCNDFVFKATYYPNDSILKYRCVNDHVNFIEDFKVAF